MSFPFVGHHLMFPLELQTHKLTVKFWGPKFGDMMSPIVAGAVAIDVMGDTELSDAFTHEAFVASARAEREFVEAVSKKLFRRLLWRTEEIRWGDRHMVFIHLG